MVRPIDIQNIYFRTADLEKMQQNQQQQMSNQQVGLGSEFQKRVVQRQAQVRQTNPSGKIEATEEKNANPSRRKRSQPYRRNKSLKQNSESGSESDSASPDAQQSGFNSLA